MVLDLAARAFVALLACSDGGPPAQPAPPGPEAAVSFDIPRATHRWDPRTGDPSVPADQGGPGFTGAGWTTRDPSVLGRADAPQGGALVTAIPDWPATLRVVGKDANAEPNSMIADLLYMPLLQLDAVTNELTPALATHWQVEGDRYRFRLDPAAHWSDGRPITADDVVATHRLLVDPTLLSPSARLVYGAFDPPVATSRYIVEVVSHEPSWRALLLFATTAILPAHQIGGSGTEYLERYAFAYPVSSGPYRVHPADIVSNESLTLTRDRAWWADDNPVYDGRYNLDRLTFRVVRDGPLALEMLKRGDLDYWAVPRAQWYTEDLPATDAVRRGLLLRRKFRDHAPAAFEGLAINERRPPLDDVRIRRALQQLFDRDTMIERLFYGEYEPLDTFFPGTAYANPENRPLPYDLAAAVRLLEEAGFTTVDSEGYRSRGGVPLRFELAYADANSARHLTVYQEAAARAGVRLELRQLEPTALYQAARARTFDLAALSMSGMDPPNPSARWRAALAETPDTNNFPGFRHPRADLLCAAYEREEDLPRRVALLRELDGLLIADQPYVLTWYSPAQRVVYWNKYGMPEPWEVGRFATGRLTSRNLTEYWWFDAERAARLEEAKADATLALDPGAEVRLYWQRWAARAP